MGLFRAAAPERQDFVVGVEIGDHLAHMRALRFPLAEFVERREMHEVEVAAGPGPFQEGRSARHGGVGCGPPVGLICTNGGLLSSCPLPGLLGDHSKLATTSGRLASPRSVLADCVARTPRWHSAQARSAGAGWTAR